jgi:hypothetical protein
MPPKKKTQEKKDGEESEYFSSDADEDETEKTLRKTKIPLLTDPRKQYVGWTNTVMRELLLLKALDSKQQIKEQYNNAVGAFLSRNMDPLVSNQIPFDLGGQQILNWLRTNYGATNKSALLQALSCLRESDVNQYFSEYNRLNAQMHILGAKFSPEFVYLTLKNRFDQPPYKDVVKEFGRRALRNEIDEIFIADFVESLKFEASQLPENPMEANFVKRKVKCGLCMKHNRIQTASSHSDKDCRFGDVPGFPEKSRHNKGKSDYSCPLILDTGATPLSFVKDEPADLVRIPGKVKVAEGSTVESKGIGKIKFGDIEIDAAWVPQLERNLISGPQLANKGYSMVIQGDGLVICDPFDLPPEAKVYATGCIDQDSQLIQIRPDNHPTPSCLATTYEEIHGKLGHIGPKTIKKTIEATQGLSLSKEEIDKQKPICKPCALGKQRRTNVPKTGTPAKEILEIIEIDLQGPFPVAGRDSTVWNVKFVDNLSGYLKMNTLPDKEAASVLKAFKHFQLRMERKTGKKVKIVRTDGGTEFQGAFKLYLQSIGIDQQICPPYRHSHPGKAERAHQTILRNARSMLIASNLPVEYYVDAQLMATYLYNRTIHGKNTLTPYELMYDKKPDLSHLYPFGCVCYSQVPEETRNKLEPSGLECRLVGYGDSDDPIEFKGYKLLDVNSRRTIHSRDVIFDTITVPSPLAASEPFSYGDHDYIPNENDDDFNSGSDNDCESEATETSHDLGNTEQLNEVESNSNDIASEPDDLIGYSNSVSKNLSDGETYNEESVLDALGISAHPSSAWIANLVQGIDLPRNAILECLNAAMLNDCPKSYDEAMHDPDAKMWKEAMDREMASIQNAKTYSIQRPTVGQLRKRPVKNRWVFTKKYDKNGNVTKFKARLVAKGFTQTKGIDYEETFSPVAKFKSIRLLAALCAKFGLEACQDDVPTAFLKGDLKEEIWMEQVQGYEVGDPEVDKCLLNRTLYGLKQSPREWNQVIHRYLCAEEFVQSKADPCIYVKKKNEQTLFVGVYVDDIISVGKGELLTNFRTALKKHFRMTEGGKLEWYLGIAFNKLEDGTVTLDQSHYLKQKLVEFNQYIGPGGVSSPLPADYQAILTAAESEDVIGEDFPYRQMVGSLMYAMLGTRPDLVTALSVVSKFLDQPKPSHSRLLKRIYHYVRANLDLKLHYTPTSETTLKGYADASYANEVNYKSRSGYACTVGGALISWYSGTQSVVAQSSAEAEYYAAVAAANEILWLKQLLYDVGYPQDTVEIFEDNQACIALTKNPEDHKRTKHVQVKYHVVRDYVNRGDVKFVYCPTQDQFADIFTKGVSGQRLRMILRQLGLHCQGES